MKRAVLLILTVLIFSLCLWSCAEAEDTVSVVNVDIVNGEIIVTYSNGEVKSLGKATQEGEKEKEYLDFYPLNDGTYAVGCESSRLLVNAKIPATYNGKAVTRIVSNAFKGCENLESVEIPSSIKSIGDNAFNNCTNLKTVTFEAGVSQCESIGTRAFAGCEELKSIVIPRSVKEVGDYAFNDCVRLESVSFERVSACNKIGEGAFDGCFEIKQILIPISVKEMGNCAFYCGVVYCEAEEQPSTWDENWDKNVGRVVWGNKLEG